MALAMGAAASPAWARAPDDDSPVVPEPTPRDVCEAGAACTEWYGGPILAIDLAAVALPFVGVSLTRSGDARLDLVYGALGLYALGGPVVHLFEGRHRAAFGSLGLRLGLPFAAGLLGLGIGMAAVSGCTGEMCGFAALGPAALGFGAGILTASIVDLAVLARKPVTSTGMSLSVIPTYQPATGARGLALSGTW